MTQACSAAQGGYADERARMVRTQIEARGVRDPQVLEAMGQVPRHLFVPEELREHAYEDRALPIGRGQTISQPYIVAVMTELLAPRAEHHVLDVGTGSGYQAAVLGRIVGRVSSIEIVPELAESARERLAALGYAHVTVITGDGYAGLPDLSPFDGILVAAAPEEVPSALLEQLSVGARLVIPVGGEEQVLRVYHRTEEGIESRDVFPVRFVPLVREPEAEGGR